MSKRFVPGLLAAVAAGACALPLELPPDPGGALPVVTGVTPAAAFAGEWVEVAGTGFSSPASANEVRFGAVRTEALEVTAAGALRVRVPADAKTPVTVRVEGRVGTEGAAFAYKGYGRPRNGQVAGVLTFDLAATAVAVQGENVVIASSAYERPFLLGARGGFEPVAGCLGGLRAPPDQEYKPPALAFGDGSIVTGCGRELVRSRPLSPTPSAKAPLKADTEYHPLAEGAAEALLEVSAAGVALRRLGDLEVVATSAEAAALLAPGLLRTRVVTGEGAVLLLKEEGAGLLLRVGGSTAAPTLAQTPIPQQTLADMGYAARLGAGQLRRLPGGGVALVVAWSGELLELDLDAGALARSAISVWAGNRPTLAARTQGPDGQLVTLLHDGDDLIRLDEATGAARWRRPGAGAYGLTPMREPHAWLLWGRRVGPRIDRMLVLDDRTGEVLRELPVPTLDGFVGVEAVPDDDFTTVEPGPRLALERRTSGGALAWLVAPEARALHPVTTSGAMLRPVNRAQRPLALFETPDGDVDLLDETGLYRLTQTGASLADFEPRPIYEAPADAFLTRAFPSRDGGYLVATDALLDAPDWYRVQADGSARLVPLTFQPFVMVSEGQGRWLVVDLDADATRFRLSSWDEARPEEAPQPIQVAEVTGAYWSDGVNGGLSWVDAPGTAAPYFLFLEPGADTVMRLDRSGAPPLGLGLTGVLGLLPGASPDGRTLVGFGRAAEDDAPRLWLGRLSDAGDRYAGTRLSIPGTPMGALFDDRGETLLVPVPERNRLVIVR